MALNMEQFFRNVLSSERPLDAVRRGPARSSSITNARITVVFRYDDCNGESSISLESALIEAFHRCRIPLTFGVTPFVTSGEVDDPAPCPAIPLGVEKIKLLKHAIETAEAEVALHGVSHQTTTRCMQCGCSEFAGLTLDSQQERINGGKQFLEKILEVPVTTLIPPWNSYDENTLRAALDSGMTTLSADAEGPAPCGSAVHFLPATCTLTGLLPAIRWARMTFDPAPVIVVLFHPYDFSSAATPRPLTIEMLVELLTWVGGQTDISTVTIAGLGSRGDDVSAARLRRHRAQYFSWISRLLPGHALRSRVYASAAAKM